MSDYAVLKTGGKQYRVKPGDVIDVERLPGEAGSTLELGDVLLVSKNGSTLAGKPLVEGAKVLAKVVDQVKGDKIIVFKYKAKTRYRRKRGHRQLYTRLQIQDIRLSEEEQSSGTQKRRRQLKKRKGQPVEAPGG